MSAGSIEPGGLYLCATCGRQCAITHDVFTDISIQEDHAAFGMYSPQGSRGNGKCGICWHAERVLAAYLLIGGKKARAFVENALATTPAILRPR